MLELKQKEIRKHETEKGTKKLHERLKRWQKENNTTGVPSAYKLGLKCIGKSYGIYGTNGILYIDLLSDECELIGIACRDGAFIYID